jgi:hypothetical protein
MIAFPLTANASIPNSTAELPNQISIFHLELSRQKPMLDVVRTTDGTVTNPMIRKQQNDPSCAEGENTL